MNKNLILISNTFPFESGEEFLVEENKYYQCFDNVYICPVNANDYSKRKIYDKNICKIIQINSKKESNTEKIWGGLKALLKKEIWDEIYYLVNTRRFSLYSLKQLLVASFLASKKKNLLIDKLGDVLSKPGTVVYTYWMREAKIAVDLKKIYPHLKVITRCHGGDLYEYRYQSDYLPFRREILYWSDRIFTISEDGRKYLMQRYQIDTVKIRTARLGIKNIYDVQYHVSNKINTLKIVSCSYCVSIKRINLIIDALAKVKCNVEWVHIGDGVEFENLKNYAAQTLPSNIKYSFTGYMNNDDIINMYCTEKYHVFINVSETEGIPVSIMEALACSIPIIATNVGGVSELVFEGVNGFLLEKNFDSISLINKLNYIHDMPEENYFEMRRHAWETWNEYYNSEKNYIAFMQELMILK